MDISDPINPRKIGSYPENVKRTQTITDDLVYSHERDEILVGRFEENSDYIEWFARLADDADKEEDGLKRPHQQAEVTLGAGLVMTKLYDQLVFFRAL